MRPYILMTRNGVEVINLAKTKEAVEVACEFVKEKVAKGGGVLFLGTQPQAHAVSQFVEMGFPAVTRRWLGGTLTNFRIISRRIEYFKKLKTDFAASAFDRYTKKERLGIEKELVRLEELFHGLTPLTELPAALVVIDPQIHKAAIHEARMLRIPVVAFANTDSDPDTATVLVPGNNKARMSVEWFLGKIKESLTEGKKIRAAHVAEKAAKDKEAVAQK
jgi:small subunit ribosomal protein S2